MTKVPSSRTASIGGSSVEYVVQAHDTVEGIAARYDCTPTQLLKMNKLASRLLFPGQKIVVPHGQKQESTSHEGGNAASRTVSAPTHETGGMSSVSSTSSVEHGSTSASASNGAHTGKKSHEGLAHAESKESSSTATGNAATAAAPADPQLDADCLQRFLKIRCKHFTDSEGVVSGVLLVTPNCVMFDPDVSHPLVIENGADRYGMVVAMDTIVSAALYKDVSALVDEYGCKEMNQGLKESIAAQLASSERQKLSDQNIDKEKAVPSPMLKPVPSSSEMPENEQTSTTAEMDAKRAELEVELAAMTLSPDVKTVLRRHVSDSGHLPGDDKEATGMDGGLLTVGPRPQAHSCPSELETDPAKRSGANKGGGHRYLSVEDDQNQSSFLPKRPSLSTLRSSLRRRANTLGGTLVQGAQAVGSGVGTLGGTIVHGAQAVGDTLTTGAKVVAKMPQNLVNMSSGLFAAPSPHQTSTGGGGTSDVLDIQESWFGSADASNKTLEQMRKRQQNYELLARLQQKTAEARQHWMSMFACATSKEEHPNLFAPVEDMLPYPRQLYSDLCTELPYYLCIRLDEKRRQRRLANRYKEEFEFGNKTKTEFWFTVPRDKADTLYAFLIQWTPDLSEEEDSGVQRSEYDKDAESLAKSSGFVVLDVNDEDVAPVQENYSNQPGSLPASLNLNREWEIVTVEEVKRRLSLLDLLEAEPQPLPEGSQLSALLDEDKVRCLMEVLPARAQGYPWALVYSSEAHGFSLRTLYRNMQQWDEEISPTLLAVKDTNGHIFGAIVNCPLRISEHFYGSGESLLFTFNPEFRYYRWTGENNFIIKGNPDSLSFGAGRGVYGLWLDGDLYHGRTQHCQTFDNEPLAGQEDFIVAGVEAWGFSLSGL